MSGLDKIINRITGESEEEAARILKEASEKADAIRADYAARTAAECERIIRKADSGVEEIKARSIASAELKEKQILLAGKQELITDTIEKVKAELNGLKGEAYIGMLRKLFEKRVPKTDAVLRLNAEDLKTLPESLLSSFAEAAAAKGAKLTVSSEAADIRNGFIIDYGGIEDNCTFDEIINQGIEELQDKAKSILFGQQ